jgi:hypothetical protein
MKKFEVTLIGTYINKIIEARTSKEAKDIFKKELHSVKGCQIKLRFKAIELTGLFA